MEELIPKEGYLIDYISGKEIKATPEEANAVQVFSKILVEDYKYPKQNIRTRPQFRVKARPSDRQASRTTKKTNRSQCQPSQGFQRKPEKDAGHQY